MTTVRNILYFSAFRTDVKCSAIIRVTTINQSIDVVHDDRPRMKYILNFFVMIQTHLLDDVTFGIQGYSFASEWNPLGIHSIYYEPKVEGRKQNPPQRLRGQGVFEDARFTNGHFLVHIHERAARSAERRMDAPGRRDTAPKGISLEFPWEALAASVFRALL